MWVTPQTAAPLQSPTPAWMSSPNCINGAPFSYSSTSRDHMQLGQNYLGGLQEGVARIEMRVQ